MTVSHSLVLLASVCLGLSACATKPVKDEKKTAPVEGPKLVGRIASIPADKRFVLIQSYGKWTVESGQVLTTRGPEERSANLRTTGETLGDFAAADLQSGLVEVGDAVYFRHIVKPVIAPLPAEPSEPAAVQGNAPIENVQKNN